MATHAHLTRLLLFRLMGLTWDLEDEDEHTWTLACTGEKVPDRVVAHRVAILADLHQLESMSFSCETCSLLVEPVRGLKA